MALDPTNIDALVGAARADVLVGAIYTTEHRAERLADAEKLLIKGISIAPRNYWAHMWLGFVQIQTNRASRAIGELEQALSLNRNLGAAHAWMGQAKITMGRAEEAEAHVDQAFRLSPNDAVAFMWTHVRGLAKFHLGADEEAVALFRRSVDASRNYPLNHFYMAAALANLGRLDEAQAEVKAGRALAPNYSIARFLSMAESDNPTYLKQRERILEGLRKAGVPENIGRTLHSCGEPAWTADGPAIAARSLGQSEIDLSVLEGGEHRPHLARRWRRLAPRLPAVARRRSPLRLLALGVVWAALALFALFIVLVGLYTFVRPVSTLMLARTVEGKSYQRIYAPLKAIAPIALASVIASEDASFCDNDGVDWGALREVLSGAGEHGPSRGASTITMQTAKNLFLVARPFHHSQRHRDRHGARHGRGLVEGAHA